MTRQTATVGLDRPWEYSAFPVTVARKAQITPGFIRVTLAGDALRNFGPWGLDQRIKLVLPMSDGSAPDFGLLEEPTPHPQEWYARWKALPDDRRNVLRTYTPAGIRPEAGEIDVDLFIHQPAGPASAWALDCRVGDALVITGPDVRAGYTGYGIHYVPSAAPSRVLLIGDESALPAIRGILAALPAATHADVIVELVDPADNTLRDLAPGVRVRVVERDAHPGAHLERAVREWSEGHRDELVGETSAYAWIAGEAAATVAIRRHLTSDIGMDKERVAFLGYWKHGGPLVG